MAEPSDFELRRRGEITSVEYLRRLDAKIAARRDNPDLMLRLERSLIDNAEVLDRLAASDAPPRKELDG